MAIRILEVSKGSLAELSGMQPGDSILKINAEDVLDEIDYQALVTHRRLSIQLEDEAQNIRTVTISKDPYAPLGLTLDERAALSPRVCKNHCIFCFVDQLPPNMRDTLYVKDDDWRLSLMMGNFVTLTNVDDHEFDRILRRKASPLYISVHATAPDVRVHMLRNPQAGKIMDRLKAMRDHHLKFHCQVVLCPGINDGEILHQTIVDLASLHPAALSLAIVPVGLTGHRSGLENLRAFTRDEARELIRDLELIQAYYLNTIGTRFVYPADELYCLAEMPFPGEDAYEGYPQIENGVGMFRQLIQECEDYWPFLQRRIPQMSRNVRHVVIPTGVSAAPHIRELVDRFASERIHARVIPVENRYFGKTVTVTGLIVGQDLLNTLRGVKADEILISCSMLRENSDCFLDDLTLNDVQTGLGIPFRVVSNTGEDFLKALYGLEEE